LLLHCCCLQGMGMHRRCRVLIIKPVWHFGNSDPVTGTPKLGFLSIPLPDSTLQEVQGEVDIMAVVHVASTGAQQLSASLILLPSHAAM
jgi:hypothetical protein